MHMESPSSTNIWPANDIKHFSYVKNQPMDCSLPPLRPERVLASQGPAQMPGFSPDNGRSQSIEVPDGHVTVGHDHEAILFEMMPPSMFEEAAEYDAETLAIYSNSSSSDVDEAQHDIYGARNADDHYRKVRSYKGIRSKFGRIKGKLLFDGSSYHSRSSSSASDRSIRLSSFSATPISTPTMARSTSDFFGANKFHSCPGRFEPQRPTPYPSSQPFQKSVSCLQNFCLSCNVYDCREHSMLEMIQAEAEPKSWFSDDSDDESDVPKSSWRQKIRRNRPRLDSLWGSE